MNWDKKGAINALEAKRCTICEQIKPVHVVVTHHGKKDVHLPCCSSECMEVVAEILAEVYQEKV